MFQLIDNYGFGQRVEFTKTLGSKVKQVRVKPIKQEDNEHVKRLKESWRNSTKSV